MTSDAAVVEPTIRYLPRRPTDSIRRPASASSTAAGGSGRVQRSSSTSALSIVRPTSLGLELAANGLDLGQLRHAQ